MLTAPFQKLWSGKYTLPVAFWLWLVLGSFLAPFVAMITYAPFYFAGMPEAKLPLFITVMVGYPVFATVGVWRSANARPFRKWPVAAAAAKVGACLWLFTIVSRVTGLRFRDVVRLLGGS